MTTRGLSYTQRMKWFHEARFGMFVHFGLYSLLGRGEWVMLNERIRADQYAELAERFNPRKFDAAEWAGLARKAGAKYMVLTSRHHDGFCLFDSQVSDFTAPKTAAGRDIAAEFVTAARREGLKVGFYYSLLDWRFPGYFEPKKYRKSAQAVVEQARAQVRELLTNYGRIDVLWYDGGWSADWRVPMDEMARFWKSSALNRMVRRLQPHIVTNNRCGLSGDLDTPEQQVEASGKGRGWETCMTVGDFCGWGYIRNNPNMKTVPQLLQHLVTAAAGEGNLLLNVGPKPDGTVRRRERKRFEAIGRWLATNGAAVYGSERCELSGGMIGMWTRKGATGYLHVFRWPGEEAVVPLVATRPVSAKVLATGGKAKVRLEENGRLVISRLPRKPPDPAVSVIEVRFEGRPRALVEKDKAAWLEGKAAAGARRARK